MRVYGRTFNEDGTYVWTVVETAPDGDNSAVYVTALIQCLLLNVNESPFYAMDGIDGQQSVMTQIFPDFYMNRIQQRFAQYFASLVLSKLPSPTPTYNIAAVTNAGAVIDENVPR